MYFFCLVNVLLKLRILFRRFIVSCIFFWFFYFLIYYSICFFVILLKIKLGKKKDKFLGFVLFFYIIMFFELFYFFVFFIEFLVVCIKWMCVRVDFYFNDWICVIVFLFCCFIRCFSRGIEKMVVVVDILKYDFVVFWMNFFFYVYFFFLNCNNYVLFYIFINVLLIFLYFFLCFCIVNFIVFKNRKNNLIEEVNNKFKIYIECFFRKVVYDCG